MPLSFVDDGTGNGSLRFPEGPFFETFVFADLNGDGFDDMVTTIGAFPPDDDGAFPARIYLGDATGALTETSITGGPVLTTFVGPLKFIRDFNGDGALDIFFGDFGFDAPPFNGAKNEIVFGDGAGGFTYVPEATPDIPTVSYGMGVGDLDGDGDLDVFDNTFDTPLTAELDQPVAFINDGNGFFSITRNIAPPTLTDTFELGGVTFTRDVTTATLLHDIDHDGAVDLIVGPENTGFNDLIRTTAVFLNDGTGDFSSSDPILAPEGQFGENALHTEIKAIDLNGDIFDDLIAVVADGRSQNSYELLLLESNGDGAFEYVTPQRIPNFGSGSNSTVSNVDLVDIELDGDIDIVGLSFSGSPSDSRPFVWLNNGNGVFDEVIFKDDVLPGVGVNAIFRSPNGDGAAFFFGGEDDTTGQAGYQTFLPAHTGLGPLVTDPPAPVPSELADVIRGDETPDTIFLLGGNDQADGKFGADMIDGGGGGDTILGGSGSDTLMGRDGEDDLRGGLGADSLLGGTGADILKGGVGDDFIAGEDGADDIRGDAGRDTASGGAGNDTLDGGSDRDTLEGGGGRDMLIGGADNDRLLGDGGKDQMFGDEGRDKLFGGGGRDVLDGGADNDRIVAGGGRDQLFGGDGRDKLFGEGGRDFISGGAGADKMTGGGGRDVFIFDEGGGTDRIVDFTQRQDRIQIKAADGFDDLTLTQSGANVLLRFDDIRVLILREEVNDFTETDFMF